MPWQDRIQIAVYTSPSGSRFEFEYENVSLASEKKTAVFLFPEKDGAFIQDLGQAGRSFPFTLFFSGEDYDIQADLFLASLEEKGIGKLEHPLYGTRVVVPTGTITRRDDLVTGANQAAFGITFSETIENITFPESVESQNASITDGVNAFEAQAATEFAEQIEIVTASESIDIQNELDDQLVVTDNALSPIAATDEETFTAYETVKTSYENNIPNIGDDPESVGQQGILLQRIPGTAATTFETKFDGYSQVINTIASQIYEPSATSLIPRNKFFAALKNSYTAIVALSEGALISPFGTRSEAVLASENILDLYDFLQDWQDDNIDSLEVIDPGESYDTMTVVVSQIVAFLINLSFELPVERRVILGEDRQMIEYIAEVYGDLTQLDFFIMTNDLTADEMEILPKGREVVYYE